MGKGKGKGKGNKGGVMMINVYFIIISKILYLLY